MIMIMITVILAQCNNLSVYPTELDVGLIL